MKKVIMLAVIVFVVSPLNLLAADAGSYFTPFDQLKDQAGYKAEADRQAREAKEAKEAREQAAKEARERTAKEKETKPGPSPSPSK
jgi:hypothetical protein